MSPWRDGVLAIATLMALVGVVAIATIGIVGAVVPASAIGSPTQTPRPTFDLAVPPQAVGGELVIDGVRSGTLVLDTASGIGGRYVDREGVGIIVIDAQNPVLQGPEGRIVLEQSTGSIDLIDYDGLSFYPDSGECTVTHGAVNEENGLMAALVECPEISDIRGKGTVSIIGVIALPAEALRGRGDLPSSGGRVMVGDTEIVIDEAEFFIDAVPNEDSERLQAGFLSEGHASGVFLEIDPEANEYLLGGVFVGEDSTLLSEPCPLDVEEIGRLNDWTTVIRLRFDCHGVEVPGGGTGSVSGEIVVDVYEAVTEN